MRLLSKGWRNVLTPTLFTITCFCSTKNTFFCSYPFARNNAFFQKIRICSDLFYRDSDLLPPSIYLANIGQISDAFAIFVTALLSRFLVFAPPHTLPVWIPTFLLWFKWKNILRVRFIFGKSQNQEYLKFFWGVLCKI